MSFFSHFNFLPIYYKGYRYSIQVFHVFEMENIFCLYPEIRQIQKSRPYLIPSLQDYWFSTCITILSDHKDFSSQYPQVLSKHSTYLQNYEPPKKFLLIGPSYFSSNYLVLFQICRFRPIIYLAPSFEFS